MKVAWKYDGICLVTGEAIWVIVCLVGSLCLITSSDWLETYALERR